MLMRNSSFKVFFSFAKIEKTKIKLKVNRSSWKSIKMRTRKKRCNKIAAR